MAILDDRSGIVVTLDGAVARGAPRAMPLAIALGPGLHALVGTPADGLADVAPLVGGIVRTVAGRVRVSGEDPARSPALRKRIGVSLADPMLPRCDAVADLFRLASELRGGGPDALAELGLETWRARKVRSLSACELRTVEIALALATPDPVAIVLTEPGASVAPTDRDALRRGLARAAAAGAAVIVATASVSDALDLAQLIHMVERGRVVRSVPACETGGLLPGRGIELRVEIDLARAFVAELTDDPAVTGVDWNEAARPSLVSVRGADIEAVALAIARAVGKTGGKLRSIAPVAPGLDEVRAASAGLALAAYHAAYAAYAAYATPWVDAARRAGVQTGQGWGTPAPPPSPGESGRGAA